MTTTSITAHAAGPVADELLVVIGLVSGAQVRGRLGRRPAEHIVDRLNNWPDPMLRLGPGAPVRTIVARSEMAWVYPLQVGADERGSSSMPAHAAERAATPAVLIHVGPFEVRGTPKLFHEVDWADFLLACASDRRFFVLVDVHLSGPETDLQVPLLAVNAARVGALATLD
jgi:hypothetical protein